MKYQAKCIRKSIWNVVCEMSAILSRPQCWSYTHVNHTHIYTPPPPQRKNKQSVCFHTYSRYSFNSSKPRHRTLRPKYHGCWCPGSRRHRVTSSHVTDHVFPQTRLSLNNLRHQIHKTACTRVFAQQFNILFLSSHWNLLWGSGIQP